MKKPIIVNRQGDISIFESVEYAELYINPIDVKNKEYVVYDSEGNRLHLDIFKKEYSYIYGRTAASETVKINSIKKNSDCSSELYKLLINFFQETRVKVEENDLLSLRALIDKSVSVYGYSQ